jgi:ATP-binding cassette, subfamily B (MDR/TAP), member 1
MSLIFGWKLGLIAVSLLPITVAAGYLRFSLLTALNVRFRKAYEGSADIACEQVAAIRTVASLNREVAIYNEFSDSLHGPVRRALYTTLQSTAVCPIDATSDGSYMLSANVFRSSLML